MNVGKMRSHYSGMLVIALLLTLASNIYSQYEVGDQLSQQSLDMPVFFCANETGSETIAGLLTPTDGEPHRVLWLNLFASW